MKRSGVFWILISLMALGLGFSLRGHWHERAAGLHVWQDGLSFYQASLPDGEWQWHSAATLLVALFLLISGWVLRSHSKTNAWLSAAAVLWSIAALSIGFLTYFPAERKVPVYETSKVLNISESPAPEASLRYASDQPHTQLAQIGFVAFYLGAASLIRYAWRSNNPALQLIRLPGAGVFIASFMLMFAYVMIPSPPGGFIQRSAILLGLGFVGLSLFNWMRLSDFAFLQQKEEEDPTEISSVGLKANDVLDGYRLLRPLGRGGFGEVWLCRCGVLSDLKALKFISGNDTQKLDKELEALRTYRHAVGHFHGDHLIPIQHVGKNEKGLYYVMPLADGHGHEDPRNESWEPYTLAKLVETRKSQDQWFEGEHVVSVMTQILEALSSLQKHQLMHRDVKPDNVLFIRGKVCLADVSLLRTHKSTLYTRLGAVNYVVPEWYDGHPDMYGVAMTMYYFITGFSPDHIGRPKFNWPKTDMNLVREDDRDLWNFFHNQVIFRATSDDKEERFRDFDEMSETLRAGAEAVKEKSKLTKVKGILMRNAEQIHGAIPTSLWLHHHVDLRYRLAKTELEQAVAQLKNSPKFSKNPRQAIKKLIQNVKLRKSKPLKQLVKK